jgi:hypothetical protein
MSALDQILSGYGWQVGDIEQARRELAQLRATNAAQAAIIKEQERQIEYITAREAAIKHNYEMAALLQVQHIANLEARLSATHSEHDSASDEWHSALVRIEEFEQTVGEARELIEFGSTMWCGSKNAKGMYNLRCQNWLAAHPAQTEQAQDAEIKRLQKQMSAVNSMYHSTAIKV